MAVGGARPPRARLDGDRRRQPHVLAGLEVRAGRGVSRRPVARRRRRRRARARSRRLQGCRAQVAERPHPSPPEGRRHPDRAERRCARPDDHGHRRRAQRPDSGRRAQGHPGAGHRPCLHRRPQGAADRPQPAARGAARGARGGPRPVREARASRRSPPNGSTAMPTRASRYGCCCPMARPSPARWPASMRAARWCWPTARAARASCPARSRCAAREREPGRSRGASRPLGGAEAPSVLGRRSVERRGAPVTRILVIDAGNSRMKWGLRGPRDWLRAGRHAQQRDRRAFAARLAGPAAARRAPSASTSPAKPRACASKRSSRAGA